MKITKREDGWWIIEIPSPGGEEAGPYDTRKEATEDMRGLKRGFDNEFTPGYWTVETSRLTSRELRKKIEETTEDTGGTEKAIETGTQQTLF